MGLSKKEGGAMRPTHQMKKFVDILNWCGMKDMGLLVQSLHGFIKNLMGLKLGRGWIGL